MKKYEYHYIIQDHHGKYVEYFLEDVLKDTWPPKGGLQTTKDVNLALWFCRKKTAVKVGKMLQCGCEKRAGKKSKVILVKHVKHR